MGDFISMAGWPAGGYQGKPMLKRLHPHEDRITFSRVYSWSVGGGLLGRAISWGVRQSHTLS